MDNVNAMNDPTVKSASQPAAPSFSGKYQSIFGGRVSTLMPIFVSGYIVLIDVKFSFITKQHSPGWVCESQIKAGDGVG